MLWRHFESVAELERALAVELRAAAVAPANGHPVGLMLSGGTTPLGVYRRLAAAAIPAPDALHVLYTDDRVVPAESPDSNYGNSRALLGALGVSGARVLRVASELGLTGATAAYERDLAAFFARGGQVRLGLLGMGADGHTCSLFNLADAARRDTLALAVPQQAGFDRVSVTGAVLVRASRLIIAAPGASKAAALQRLRRDPASVPTGLAVAGHPAVELWTDVVVDL